MAEGVTYADLRFAKSPPEKGPRPLGDAPEEASDGELTYENFSAAAAARPRQPHGPDPAPQAPGALLRRRLWSAVPPALLGACLFLLAACLGLGLRYWQVSRQLAGASQSHRAESSALAERLGGQEENLTRAQEELSATRLALGRSWQAGNATRRQLEEERERWNRTESRLQRERDQARRELEAAKRVLAGVASCQQTDCCPRGWKHFSRKCLWVASRGKTWEESKQDCESREAQLLIVTPREASTTIWDKAVIPSNQRSWGFWIGLHRTSTHPKEWRWVDGTPYTGKELGSSYYNCGEMSQGSLRTEYCSYSQRYVCEKVADPFPGL